jgi:SAM-dependent methyltransferase
MSAVQQAVEVDGDKLMQFVFRAVDEVGATLNTALVVMGDKLGLYRALADGGALSPADLAHRTGTAERYVREWLNAQAAGGFVAYDPDSGRYTLPPEQAVALTDQDSPAYLPGFFQIALGSVIDSPEILEKARSGDGFGWHEHVHDVHEGCERFFRPGYNAHLTAEWLPELDGVVAKLEQGALVADAGCGHGSSTILMAQAYPDSTFVGSDYHEGSIETARQRARDAGVSDRVSFQVASASGVQRHRIRPRDDVRLPARHGRSDRRCAPRTFDAEARWDMDDRRAERRRPRGGQLQPGRACLLLVLDAALHPGVAFPGGRARAWGAGRRGPDPGRRSGGRLHALPARRRDAVQPRVRGAPVGVRGVHPVGPI